MVLCKATFADGCGAERFAPKQSAPQVGWNYFHNKKVPTVPYISTSSTSCQPLKPECCPRRAITLTEVYGHDKVFFTTVK